MPHNPSYPIERLSHPVAEADLHSLAQLLVDAVDSGAAVSFLQPLDLERAEAWWRKTIQAASPGAIFLVARDAAGIIGTVQLHPSWAPNQPHHAEIAKLIVHRRARGAGVGKALMRAVEEQARRAGLELLTLDTKRGSPAEQLYLQLGWTRVGVIPGYALDPDGSGLHDTVIFYKTVIME